MNLLLVGLSHRSAPVSVLERVSLPSSAVGGVLEAVMNGGGISEALVLSTCGRVEVCAVAETMHVGLPHITSVLARHAGMEAAELSGCLYVQLADSAVTHLFSVSAGLKSMVVGEAQILGQLRTAYAAADDAGTVGTVLHELVQHALRAGKRVRAETCIDRAGASLVSEALAEAAAHLGGLAGLRALVIGAGSVGGLAAAHLRRAGIGEVVFANRTEANGARLADTLRAEGVPARSIGLGGLREAIAHADMVLGCASTEDVVIDAAMLDSALLDRASARSLVLCDLGLPRNIDPRAARLAGLRTIDLESLHARLGSMPAGLDIEHAARIVAEEVSAYLAGQRSAGVTPTVIELRRRWAEVADAEVRRLESRLPGLEERVRAELDRTVHRVVDKLLHAPTVRMKQLSSTPGGTVYADALRELFDIGLGTGTDASASISAAETAPGRVSVDRSHRASQSGSAAKRQSILTLDMEGVLTPEIWVAVAELTGVPHLRFTTRDDPDYEALMRRRLALLEHHDITLPTILEAIQTLRPLPGAREFLDVLRAEMPVILLSDTFEDLAQPLLRQLGWPTLLCHRLELEEDRIVGYRLRRRDHKRESVLALKALGYRVVAAGDSFNDAGMLAEADEAFLFHAPEKVAAAFPRFTLLDTYAALLEEIREGRDGEGSA